MKISISQSKNIEIISTMLALAIIYMEIFKNESETASSVMMPIIVLCGAALSGICYGFYRKRVHINTVCLILFAVFVSVINYCLVQQIVLGRLVSILLIYLPVGLFFSFHIKNRACMILAKCFFVICSLRLLLTFLSIGNGITLFYKTTRNYISIYITILLFVVTLYSDSLGKKVNLWIPIFYFLCCILSLGRGGVIAASVYLTLQFYFRFFRKNARGKVSSKWTIGFFILSVTLFFLAFNYETILTKYFGNFLVNHSSSDHRRFEIISTYFARIFSIDHIDELFFGMKTIDMGYLGTKYEGNLHNSILMFHSFFGIFGIILLIPALVYSIRRYWKQEQWDMLSITVCFLIRSLSDYCYPGYLGDVFIWYFILSYVNRKRTANMMFDELQTQ